MTQQETSWFEPIHEPTIGRTQVYPIAWWIREIRFSGVATETILSTHIFLSVYACRIKAIWKIKGLFVIFSYEKTKKFTIPFQDKSFASRYMENVSIREAKIPPKARLEPGTGL